MTIQNNPTEKELMSVVMTAATDLIQTYDSSLSTAAIQTRMKRIAGDLLGAAGANGEGDGTL